MAYAGPACEGLLESPFPEVDLSLLLTADEKSKGLAVASIRVDLLFRRLGTVRETAAFNIEAAARHLCQLGAKIDGQGAESGNTALHTAVKNRHLPAIRALLSLGARLDLKNTKGETVRDLVFLRSADASFSRNFLVLLLDTLCQKIDKKYHRHGTPELRSEVCRLRKVLDQETLAVSVALAYMEVAIGLPGATPTVSFAASFLFLHHLSASLATLSDLEKRFAPFDYKFCGAVTPLLLKELLQCLGPSLYGLPFCIQQFILEDGKNHEFMTYAGRITRSDRSAFAFSESMILVNPYRGGVFSTPSTVLAYLDESCPLWRSPTTQICSIPFEAFPSLTDQELKEKGIDKTRFSMVSRAYTYLLSRLLGGEPPLRSTDFVRHLQTLCVHLRRHYGPPEMGVITFYVRKHEVEAAKKLKTLLHDTLHQPLPPLPEAPLVSTPFRLGGATAEGESLEARLFAVQSSS